MIAIVSGGTRGIGLAIVERLINMGVTPVVTARSITDKIQGFVDEGRCYYMPCDISCARDRQSLVEYAQSLGKIELLVNNAGVAPKKRLDMLDMDEESFDFVMNINLKGTFFLTQAVANIMKSQHCGRIINISSMSSYTASENRAEYCISKAGITMITKLFASKMAEYGVGVFEIAPGIIDTEMTSTVQEKYTKLIDEGITPIRRMGVPIDIANCVECIQDGKLDFCTGTVINCDGGFSVRRL